MNSLSKKLFSGAVLLFAVMTLGFIALDSWWVNRLSASLEERVIATIGEVGAAQIAEIAPDDGDSINSVFRQWAIAASNHDLISGVILRDASGKTLHTYPGEGVHAVPNIPERQEGEANGTGIRRWNLGEDPGLQVLEIPIPGRDKKPQFTLLMLSEVATARTVWTNWAVGKAVPSAGLALVGLCVSVLWLRSSVHKPLRSLLEAYRRTDAAERGRPLAGRRDEFGFIAREAEELHSELHDTRAELDRLQRTIESRVLQRTREINATLRVMQKQAWLDPLTKLANRRVLEERLEDIFDRQQAMEEDLSIVMLDIDNFKEHNDTHGHAAGDEMLRFCGQLLNSSIREADMAIRYAGDEFAVLLPGVSAVDAANLATRVVRMFAQQTATLATNPQPTLSAGVASIRKCSPSTGRQLLELADRALYDAKNTGKNDVCISDEVSRYLSAATSPQPGH